MPIVLAVLDYLFLGRELPNMRSTICLGLLLVGAVLYTLTDSGFQINGYVWIVIWYVVFCIDFAYVKFVISKVEMSTYGRVYYQSIFGSVALLLMAVVTGEFNSFQPQEWGSKAWGSCIVSCFLGMGMSTFSYRLRAMVSSTQMAILGNVCKVITVLLNWAIWDKHASPPGLAALGLCLLAAYNYEQAPMRASNEEPMSACKNQKLMLVMGFLVMMVGSMLYVSVIGVSSSHEGDHDLEPKL